VDTELPAFQAWQELYQEHGASLPLEQWAASLGGSGAEFDACAYLEQQLGRAIDREGLRVRRWRRKLELVASQPLLPGVETYLREARSLGLKVGLASSSSHGWVSGILDRLGIVGSFDCVVCGDDVTLVKPNPEIYLRALQALHLRPDEAIVLEDSPNGIIAAQAAGIFCVVVPNELTALLPIKYADLQVDSLADLPLDRLLETVTLSGAS